MYVFVPYLRHIYGVFQRIGQPTVQKSDLKHRVAEEWALVLDTSPAPKKCRVEDRILQWWGAGVAQ